MPEQRQIADADSDDTVAPPEIVIFLLGPDGEPLEDGGVEAARSLGDIYRTWRQIVAEEREDEDYRRRPRGERRVQGVGRPGRRGYRDEILITLRTDPMRAASIATAPGLFEPDIPRLTVEQAAMAAGRYELSWPVAIRVGPRRRQATLRMYASPSLNVTVLSLIPAKQRTIATPGFVRVGLRVMNALRDRIDDRATG